MGDTPNAKRLRDLLVDFYLEHNPEKLQRGLDINGIVMWTGRNGIDALNEVLRNQTGHTLDLNKNLGGAKKQALRISTAFNPNKARVSNTQANEKILLSKIHSFYIKNDPSKLVNIHKLHKYALTNGEEALNKELRKKYGQSLPKELPNFQQQKAALQNGMVAHPGTDAAVILKNISSGPPAIQNLAINANNVGNINGKKKRRKRKGELSVQQQNDGFQPANRISAVSAFVPPSGPAPAVAPKVGISDRNLPPLPPKNKPIPALPSKTRMLTQDGDDDEFTVIDDDFDEDAVKTELEGFFRFHDDEQLEAIYEYVDLYAEQGREHINQMFSNFYGESLDEFARKTQHGPPDVPVKMSFTGTSDSVKQVKGMKLTTNMNFNPNDPSNHISFTGHASTSMAPVNSPRMVLDNNTWNKPSVTEKNTWNQPTVTEKNTWNKPSSVAEKNTWNKPSAVEKKTWNQPSPAPTQPNNPYAPKANSSFTKPRNNSAGSNGKTPYKTTVAPPPLPKSRKPNSSNTGQGQVKAGSKPGSQLGSRDKRKVGARMSRAFGSVGSTLKKSFRNLAGNRHSLSPNAGNDKLFAPMEATPEAGPCDNYRLDMLGGSFGVCVCGFSRNDHSYKAKFGAPRKNVFKSTSTKFNPSNVQASSQQNLFNQFENNTEANNSRVKSQMSGFDDDFDTTSDIYANNRKLKGRKRATKATADYSTPYDVVRKQNQSAASGVGFRTQYMATNRRADVVNQNTEIKKQQEVVKSKQSQPCDMFRLDIHGKFHGDCVCGFSKFAHKTTTSFQSDRNNNAYQNNLQNARKNLGTLQRSKKNQRGRNTNNNFNSKPTFRSTFAPAPASSFAGSAKSAGTGGQYGSYQSDSSYSKQGSAPKLGYGGFGTTYGGGVKKTSHGAIPRKRPKRVVPVSEKDGHRSDPGKGNYCSRCNESFSAQFKFCGKCGAKLA